VVKFYEIKSTANSVNPPPTPLFVACCNFACVLSCHWSTGRLPTGSRHRRGFVSGGEKQTEHDVLDADM